MHFQGLRYSPVTITNYTIFYTQRSQCKFSVLIITTEWELWEVKEVMTHPVEVIIAYYIHTYINPTVHLKLTYSYVSIMSQKKLEKLMLRF